MNAIMDDKTTKPTDTELLAWLRGKLAEAEHVLKLREQMEESWKNGTDSSWRAVGCKLNRPQRLQESRQHARIAVKNRLDVQMFKSALAAIENRK